jgi:hypothetical protein
MRLTTTTLDILAARIRAALPEEVSERTVEKRMFGGVGFMLSGNLLCCATRSGGVLLRVGTDNLAAALALPTARPFINGSRPMTGYVMMDGEGIADEAALQAAVESALRFVETLPFKEKSDKPKKKR